MSNKLKKIVCCILFCVLTFSFSACSNNAQKASETNTVSVQQLIEALNNTEANVWDYEQDFSNLTEVNRDFTAHYLTQFMGERFVEKVENAHSASAHWAKSPNGGIARFGDIRPAEGMANYAILSYTGKRLANFRMQVDIKQGTATNFWAMIGIRTEEAGKHFFADGLAYYTESDGSVKAWGHGLHGGPYELGKIANYSQSEYQTITVTVSGNYCTIAANGSTIVSILPARFYRQGFVTFYSANNDTALRNFKIKELPRTDLVLSDFPPNQSLPSADTDDSLDNLAKS